MSTDSAAYLTEFHQILQHSFNPEEVRTLCFQLNVDYESVAGEEKQARIRELLLALARRGRLQDLITLVQQVRPHIAWPPVPDDFQLPTSLASGVMDVPEDQYHVYGDVVHGDKIHGDRISLGDVTKAKGAALAAGRGAIAKSIQAETFVEKQVIVQAVDVSELGQLLETPDTYQFYESLLKLNYVPNVKSFLKFLGQKTSIGAFLIHGVPDSGQRWLLNKLYLLLRNKIEAKIIKRDFRRLSRRNDVDDIWRELGNQVGLRHEKSPKVIAEKICVLCQTKPVIIVFFGINQVPGKHIGALIEEFWKNVVTVAQERGIKHPLLLFLVDYENKVPVDQAYYCKEIDTSWNPTQVIGLQLLEVFSGVDLKSWLEHESQTLPEDLIFDLDESLQNILTESENGIPELVFDAICYLCGFNWDEEKEKWLKI